MASISHYEDVVDVQMHFLTRMRQRLSTSVNSRPAIESGSGADHAIAQAINAALEQRKIDEVMVYDEMLREVQSCRPAFHVGEHVAVLGSTGNDYGMEGLVLDAHSHDNNGGAQPTYEVLMTGGMQMETVEHELVRPSMLWGGTSPQPFGPYSFTVPYQGPLDPADAVVHADIIHEFGNRINMLREAVRAADQIHKHTDKENDEQKTNADKTRATILSEVMGSLHAVRTRMEEEHLRYVHGRFYRMV